ncbi:hypothetical protein ACGFK1_08715 [Mycobacterium sp. NPDC048908]|uniref:hypothetical protein n=1 Tax=Mycobacterium sp. NPDC048908 TaxID=3364292 RepID=UPI003715D82A
MTKGKYKSRKQNRDASKLGEDLVRVRDQLVEEQRRLAEMRERAELDARLRADLAEAIAARDAVCAPQLQRIADDREVIRAVTRDRAAANRSIRRHSQKVTEWGLRELGAEYFYALVTGNRMRFLEGVYSTNLKGEAVETIQRARGLRTRPQLDFTAEQKKALTDVAAAAAGIALPDDVTDVDDSAWDRYTEMVAADSAALIAFRTPVPWLDIAEDHEHSASRILGANPVTSAVTVTAPESVPTITELSTGSAAQRDAATAAGATKVADAFIETLQRNVFLAAESSIPSPVAGGPAYPAPADAASMQAWYAASAIGAWGRHRTEVNGRVAVASAAAVPFWLPPGHTIAYLDSEPLSGEDIEDLRMPFPQVLVTFAEPARLPAIDPSVLDGDPRMRWIDHLAATSKVLPDGRDMFIGATNSFQAPLPTLWDAIASRGAHIEAVLLLADAHGHLDDLFAWCVAVPSAAAGRVLGRWVIPASRQATSYGNLVANAAAVAAWADWHRPGHSRSAEEQREEPAGSDAGAARKREDTVHVLNVTATTPVEEQPAVKGEPTGRTTAPHRRRGHWRRQHFGPGRTQTRRVRIAPVMVNAGRLGADRPQIYRLPAPKLSESAAISS